MRGEFRGLLVVNAMKWGWRMAGWWTARMVGRAMNSAFGYPVKGLSRIGSLSMDGVLENMDQPKVTREPKEMMVGCPSS